MAVGGSDSYGVSEIRPFFAWAAGLPGLAEKIAGTESPSQTKRQEPGVLQIQVESWNLPFCSEPVCIPQGPGFRMPGLIKDLVRFLIGSGEGKGQDSLTVGATIRISVTNEEYRVDIINRIDSYPKEEGCCVLLCCAALRCAELGWAWPNWAELNRTG